MALLALLVAVATVAGVAYHWYFHGYWRRRGVPAPRPLPFVGNLLDNLLMRKAFTEVIDDLYREHVDDRFFGIYKFHAPVLVLRDPALVSAVTERDFAHFARNLAVTDERLDPIVAHNLFVLDAAGAQWRAVRKLLTRFFTHASLARVAPHCAATARRLADYAGGGGTRAVDAFDVARRYSIDNVLDCGYGVRGEALEVGSRAGDELVRETQYFTGTSRTEHLQTQLIFLFPRLARLFNVSIFSPALNAKLFDMTDASLAGRRAAAASRDDFVQLLEDARARGDCPYVRTDRDVAINGGQMYVDGAETASLPLAFALYEIAADEAVQLQLREEILAGVGATGEPTFDAVAAMQYLDQVFKETLRLYPPFGTSFKVCTRAYNMGAARAGAPDYVVEPGTVVVLPIHSLHHDARHFARAERFEPERFAPERRGELVPHTYIPFLAGPRKCLGLRFAELQIKTAIVTLLQRFRLSVNARTQRPLRIDPVAFMLMVRGGLWLDFEPLVS